MTGTALFHWVRFSINSWQVTDFRRCFQLSCHVVGCCQSWELHENHRHNHKWHCLQNSNILFGQCFNGHKLWTFTISAYTQISLHGWKAWERLETGFLSVTVVKHPDRKQLGVVVVEIAFIFNLQSQTTVYHSREVSATGAGEGWSQHIHSRAKCTCASVELSRLPLFLCSLSLKAGDGTTGFQTGSSHSHESNQGKSLQTCPQTTRCSGLRLCLGILYCIKLIIKTNHPNSLFLSFTQAQRRYFYPLDWY